MNQNRLKSDEEERSILWDFERGEFESIKNFRAEKQRLEQNSHCCCKLLSG